VMTSSGSLAHIYFAQEPENLCLEEIEERYPGLIEALVSHDGVGLVMLRCKDRPPIVLGARGGRELDDGGVADGDDPLEPYGKHTHAFFRRLAEYEYTGDIVVNGAYDPAKRWVIGFDELVGAHGGVGGPQTQPFLIYPAGWTDEAPELVGSVEVHQFLKRHTSASPPPPCAREGSERTEQISTVAETAEQPAVTGDGS
jgi:putative membrane protein